MFAWYRVISVAHIYSLLASSAYLIANGDVVMGIGIYINLLCVKTPGHMVHASDFMYGTYMHIHALYSAPEIHVQLDKHICFGTYMTIP